MVHISEFLLKHRKGCLIIAAVVVLCCAALIPFVSVNYDLSKYLPPDSISARTLDKMADEFHYGGTGVLMAENISISQAIDLKQRLKKISGVNSVLWLDDVADLDQPTPYIDPDLLEMYYQNNCALFTITFDEDDYSLRTGEALVAVREAAADYDPAIYGTAEESRNTRSQMSRETINIMLVIIPICVLILLIIASSWFEPVLYLLVICAAVVINMGTNLIFSSVSFVIFSMGAAIQLAVSMDYSLFLTHRFEEELDRGLPLREALLTAVKRTFPSIFSSALTTVVGFSALSLMRYSIGRDIGLVLAKGVCFSFLCVMLLLPPLLYACYPLIKRTRHRTLLSVSTKWARRIIRPRYIFLVAAIIVVVPCYLGQLNTPYFFGDSSGSVASGQFAEEKARISEHFPISDQIVLLVPNGDVAAEVELTDVLDKSPYVDSVQSLVTMVSPTIPRAMLPQALLDNFQGVNYSRIIVNVNTVVENEQMFDCVEQIGQFCRDQYGEDWYMVGKAVSISDIRDSVTTDIDSTMAFSMLAVAMIILLAFRSLLAPVLLVAVIQSAIYINMSVPYFIDQPLVFIGYLVVSALQLGATIDYAILLASRYTESRATMLPHGAVAEAVRGSAVSVITSSLILATAGFAEFFMSSMSAVSAIGLLIARGALLSAALVLIVLPALLTMFDTPLRVLTWRARFLPKPKRSDKHEASPDNN